jgi:general secretion pathway protein I
MNPQTYGGTDLHRCDRARDPHVPTGTLRSLARLRRASRLPCDTIRGLVPAARSRVAGFSLLEVLVAFVILALVGTALFRLFSGALNNASAADDYSRAVLVAESALAEAASTQPLREATQQGTVDDGRIEWTTRVTAYAPQGVNPDTERASDAMNLRLFKVSAEVAFPAQNGGRHTLTLATTRIGAKDAR